MKTNDIKRLRENRVQPYLADNEDLALAGQVCKDSIVFFTRQRTAANRIVIRNVCGIARF